MVLDKGLIHWLRMILLKRIQEVKTYSWVNLLRNLTEEFGYISDGLLYYHLNILCEKGLLIKTQALVSKRKTWFTITSTGEQQVQLLKNWMKEVW